MPFRNVCFWCGDRYADRIIHVCPLNAEMREALKSFAEFCGRTWRYQLRKMWARGNREKHPQLWRILDVCGEGRLNRMVRRKNHPKYLERKRQRG